MAVPASPFFEVTISGTHGVVIPDAMAQPFVNPDNKRVQLTARYKDKTVVFHGALHKYDGNYMISFGKRYQQQIGVDYNDYFELRIEEDNSKYGVEVPEEFSAVMESDPEASEIFESFTDGKKRSLIYYVLKIKNSQTRIDKTLIISENIKMGIKDPKELIKDRR